MRRSIWRKQKAQKTKNKPNCKNSYLNLAHCVCPEFYFGYQTSNRSDGCLYLKRQILPCVAQKEPSKKVYPTVTNKDGTGGLSQREGQRDVASTPPSENVLIFKCFFNGGTKELLYFKNSRRLRKQHGLSPQPFILANISLAFLV